MKKTTVQELLEEEEGLTQETEQPKEKSEETRKDNSEDLITEEYVEAYGLSKNLVGKTFKELGKSYSELNKIHSKQGVEIGELRKSVQSLTEQVTKKEEAKAEKETVDEFGNMPDPIDDPEAYKGWMKGFKNNLMAEVKSKILEELRPKLESAKDLSTKDQIKETIKLIQDGLPEGEDAEKILAEYVKENQEYFQEIIAMGRSKNPNTLALETLKDYKAKKFDENKQLTDEEITKRASEIAQNQLKKKVSSTKVSDHNSQSREIAKGGLIAEIVADLEAEKE